MNNFVKAQGIWYRNEIKTIKKRADVPMQPIFEAFMNAWESVLDRFSREHFNKGFIHLSIYRIQTLFANCDFEKIVVHDNGLGLDEASLKRLIDLRNDTKKHSNLGTGRIQFIHFFDHTTINSVYKKGETYRRRKVTLSKNEAFLNENAILRLDEDNPTTHTNLETDVIFETPLDDKDKNYYSALSATDFKDELIRHFLSLFCEYKNQLPQIHISVIENQEVKEECDITISDIPNPDKEDELYIDYSKLNEKNKIVSAGHQEKFQLTAFKLSSSEIKQNAIYLVSKGATGISFDIESIQKKDEIDGKRYMILLSGKYLDECDRDDRGNIQLINSKDFKQQNEDKIFKEEVVLLDNITEATNKSISKLYNELDDKNQEKNKTIDELQQMFLLNPTTVNRIRRKIKNTDSEETILRVIYQADSEIEAQKDDVIRKQLEELKALTPDNTENYQAKLQEKVDEFVAAIPIQNRTALSKYVARRKIVLDLFDEILNRELELLKNGKHIDEKVLHNLIFQQSNNAPSESDLWLINEEYIYFRGISDQKLGNIEFNGSSLLKNEDELSDEEKAYKRKCEHDAGDRKPDILLFPQEGKCIIIEFKAPHVDVANHLHQINRYARLIHNLSSEQYHFTTYYGFLIGENIDIEEIRDSDPTFQSAATLNYIFRPYLPVAAKFGRKDGALYTEIIKYSDLLERAKLRNRVFIDKLENGYGE